jgi:hypothetical protein
MDWTPGQPVRPPRPHATGCLAAVCLLVAALLGCGDDDYYPYDDACRYEPGLCGGGLGGLCGATVDCAVGFCCRGPKECGDGVCTLSCRNDLDCPVGMGCEHDMCLFSCVSDRDCAAGQRCGHGHTVCEW